MSPQDFHILVGGGDEGFREIILNSLTTAGFRVDVVIRQNEIFDAVRARRFDLAVLHVGPAENTGIEICRSLRARYPELGIVIALAGGEADEEIRALDAGADDCIAPPFRFREIVARVGAVLRRARIKHPPQSPVLRAGDLEVNAQQRLFRRGGREVHLSPREFDLLFYLMTHQEVTLTHTRLLLAVWGSDVGRDPRYLRTYVTALRRKIEKDPARPQYILTEPWVGYRFNNPAS